MTRLTAFLRSLVPYSHEGRQTLVYLIFAGAGPVLTVLVFYAMLRAFNEKQWGLGGQLANKLGWGLLIIVCALACFVALRAIKLGPGGLDVQGRDKPDQ
jgi:small-conductance mechanosensitive channel